MIIFALEDIRSVYNVGSIFRTGEGFGFRDFALIGITPTPLDKNGQKRKDFHKTALGAEDSVTWEYFESTKKLLEKYPDYEVVSLEITAAAQDISALSKIYESDKNYIVVFGSEVDGVSQYALTHSKYVIKIPMSGIKESFNVSITAAICMYVLHCIR
jgi:23S rRNA (guanosine2251-2'-O)-methyltransferase